MEDGKKEIRILMVGLDAAGKTTILYKLKLGKIVETIPTIGYNDETFEYRDTYFAVRDVGGMNTVRALWYFYLSNRQAVIFVVDSSDRERITEARDELFKLLSREELSEAVLLIFANKQDLPNSMPASELNEKLGLDTLRNRLWYIQATRATQADDGLYEGLDCLLSELAKTPDV